MNNPCQWTGISGWPYLYEAYPLGTPIIHEPGNYALCRFEGGYWRALYFGEAEDLGRRCCNSHEKWSAAIRMGATHIHLRFNAGGRQARLDEEKDLRHAFRPPLNDQ